MARRRANLLSQVEKLRGEGPGRSGQLLRAGSGLPRPLQPCGALPLAWLREPREERSNWSLHPEPIKKPQSVQEKPFLGQCNPIARDQGTGKASAPSEGKGHSESENSGKSNSGGGAKFRPF